jgi:outer membrane protein OmpA-like peptidoglycan-associated protein
MRRLIAGGALALLAGCGGDGSASQQRADVPEAVPSNDRTSAARANPADAGSATSPDAMTASGPVIGMVSGLSATTRALTGTISDFAVRTTDKQTVVALAADTLFEFGKADLTRAAEVNLARTADLVANGGAGTIEVIGYTDAKGTDALNDTLSRRRADAVVAWLKTQPGLNQRGFTAIGKGKRDPVAPNVTADGTDDPQGRARNRRVEVVIPR